MNNYLLRCLPPQAVKVYKVLRTAESMSAVEIGKSLRIYPNAVYRNAQVLLDLGFIEKISDWPLRYRAISSSKIEPVMLEIMRRNFFEAFGGPMRVNQPSASSLQLDFFGTKRERLRHIYRDTDAAKESIHMIASGLEVSAETLLHFKRAIDRGVAIQVLVQNLDEVHADMFRNWQRIGISVKYATIMHARLYVFDRRITYLSSYESRLEREAVGVRFLYAPCARLLDDLFNQRWNRGKEIQP